MHNLIAYVYCFVAVLLAAFAVLWYTSPLRRIPTIGGTDAPLFSYFTARNFARHGRAMLREGYQKYHGGAFKIALWDMWLVVVSGNKMVDDLRRRPDEEVNFLDGSEEIVQMRYTVGTEYEESSYHIDIIRDKLTRSLPAIFPHILDELTLAIGEHIPAKDDEWLAVHVMTAMQKVIARASNRVFVGIPLCRNEEYLKQVIRFAVDVFQDKDYLNRFPRVLKYLVGRYVSKGRKTVQLATDHLKPIVEDRLKRMKEYGEDWEERPNDLLQWQLDHPDLDHSSMYLVTKRILNLNLAAIHTTSNSITHAIYHLAASPECQQLLREEVEALVSAEGWSKAAMGKMWKLDSFMKESQRYNGVSLTAMTRKVLKDMTLLDGTFLPKDTVIVVATDPAHYDENNYTNANTFDPFRFARMREADGEDTKHQLVNTSLGYMPFGHGKHACPGRFFAANEMKAILAYIVLNYDLKIDGDGKRPANIYYANEIIPAVDGMVLFRKRQYPPKV